MLFASTKVLHSPAIEHRTHNPVVVTFQPLETNLRLNHPENMVMTFEGFDIRNNLHLLQQPLYALDLAGEEISLETLSQLRGVKLHLFIV